MSIIAVSGATGLLGRAVLDVFEKSFPKNKVVGLGFSRSSDGIMRCDLSSKADVDLLFSDIKPVVFVHCAAERRPDVVESGNPSAKAVNISATEILAAKCYESNCKLVFLSTDYVFDGTKAPYTESDPPNPLNTYGLQKVDGERIVLGINAANVIVRIPVLYGPLNKSSGLDESAVTVLFKAVKNVQNSTNMDHVAIRYPTYTLDVACSLRNIVKELLAGNEAVKGIFHVSANEPLTKYEMSCRMASLFGLPNAHLIADKESHFKSDTRRPTDCHLDCSRARNLNLLANMTPFDEGIKCCLAPFI